VTNKRQTPNSRQRGRPTETTQQLTVSRNMTLTLTFETASVVQWSESLATDPEVWVQFPALSDFPRSSGSATRSTQPREYNRGAT
jgi:hypothetical protein